MRNRDGRGFSIIELLVVIGVILILVSLMLPPLSKSIYQSRLTRAMALTSQAAALVGVYANDYDGMYPLSSDRLFTASKYWHTALLEGGYIENLESFDPRGARETGHSTVALSMCMVYDPDLMRPDTVVPIGEAKSRPVRAGQVLYPSDKGMMWQWWIDFARIKTFWCCNEYRPVGPVAMADSSVLSAEWLDFRHEPPPDLESQIGFPIMSTWGGFLARDR